LIVQYRDIKIYDVNNFELLRIINSDLKFIAYHNELDLLISEDMCTYRFNGNEFSKITFGSNYLVDYRFAPNNIMDTTLCECLLFGDLPREIICIELYNQILIVCGNIDTF